MIPLLFVFLWCYVFAGRLSIVVDFCLIVKELIQKLTKEIIYFNILD